MAVNSVTSNNAPAAAPVRQPEAKPASERPPEKTASPPQQAAPAPPAPRPVINTSGQLTGGNVNTSA
jgi:hypothetical protein